MECLCVIYILFEETYICGPTGQLSLFDNIALAFHVYGKKTI